MKDLNQELMKNLLIKEKLTLKAFTKFNLDARLENAIIKFERNCSSQQ